MILDKEIQMTITNNAEDLNIISEYLQNDAIQKSYRNTFWFDLPKIVEQFNNEKLIIFKSNGNIIGYSTYICRSENKAIIEFFEIFKNNRKMGYGRKCYMLLETYLLDQIKLINNDIKDKKYRMNSKENVSEYKIELVSSYSSTGFWSKMNYTRDKGNYFYKRIEKQ